MKSQVRLRLNAKMITTAKMSAPQNSTGFQLVPSCFIDAPLCETVYMSFGETYFTVLGLIKKCDAMHSPINSAIIQLFLVFHHKMASRTSPSTTQQTMTVSRMPLSPFKSILSSYSGRRTCCKANRTRRLRGTRQPRRSLDP